MKFIHLASIAVLFTVAEAIRTSGVDVPEHFQADTDDIFMRSMYEKYVSYPKDKDGKDIKSKHIITKSSGMALADEVVGTHKKLEGAEKADYIAKYFEKAWYHFDVNKVEYIEALQAPSFVRFLLSNQFANIYGQKAAVKN